MTSQRHRRKLKESAVREDKRKCMTRRELSTVSCATKKTCQKRTKKYLNGLETWGSLWA